MSGVRRLGASSVFIGDSARALGPKHLSPASATADDDAAVDQAQAAFKTAYLEGFDAGHADGTRDALREHEQMRSQLETMIEDARVERERWQEQTRSAAEQLAGVCEEQQGEVEPIAIEVAYAAVCKILGTLHTEKKLVAAVCREILRGLQAEPVQIRVSEDDVASMQELAASIEVVGDGSLAPGDCVVRSGTGDIDGGIAHQLATLRRALHAELGMAESP